MIRYWKIFLLTIISVVVIGVFYIQSSLAAKDAIKIEFEKISGNEGELKELKFYGSYPKGNFSQSFNGFANKEVDIFENRSIIEQLTYGYSDPVIKKLIDKYRSFMRGKVQSTDYFFEDENLIAYAGVKRNYFGAAIDFTFDIDILNKKSNETTSFEYELPYTETYGWYDIVNAEVSDSQLQLITRSSLVMGGEEVGLYTFNIDEKKLVSKETLLSTESTENGGTDLNIVHNQSSLQAEQYLILQTAEYEFNDYGESIANSREVFFYNIETNQLKELTLPDELQEQMYSSTLEGSKLYIPLQMDGSFEVNEYDLEKEVWGDKKVIELPGIKNDYESFFSELLNGKIYITYSTNDGHAIYIGDLATGKSLYEGKLSLNTGNKDVEKVYIYDIQKGE